MRFVLRPPQKTRSSLLVHTARVRDAAAIERLRRDMHGIGCANGLLFTPEDCIILRDSFNSTGSGSIRVEPQVFPTADVLAPIGRQQEPLDARVDRWLRKMSEDWQSALPRDPKLAGEFYQDIVRAASGTVVVREHDENR